LNASTTKIIYGARITDGTIPSIHQAINAPTELYPTHAITIYYSY
jgi:hypothetical protein